MDAFPLRSLSRWLLVARPNEFKIHFVSRTRPSQVFTSGVKEGQWTAWFEDGRLTEGYYVNGKKDATWTSWWDHERTRKEMQGERYTLFQFIISR